LREESRLRMFANRVLRGIFGAKRDGVREECRNYIMGNFTICSLHPILSG